MTSPKKFIDFLNATRPEDEKILIALRFYLAEATEDRLPRDLQADLQASADEPSEVDAAFAELKRNRAEQVRIALAFFEERWEDEGQRERILRAFQGAVTKLPVIELGLITIFSMYALWLLATGGRRRGSRTTLTRADGTFETKEVDEFFPPTGPLSAVASLVTGWGKKGKE